MKRSMFGSGLSVRKFEGRKEDLRWIWREVEKVNVFFEEYEGEVNVWCWGCWGRCCE